MTRLSVLIGVAIGALIGLLIGDSWTAVWLGLFGAFASAWASSLDWHGFAERSEKLSAAFKVSGSGTATLKALLFVFKTTKEATITAGKIIRLILSDKEYYRGIISAIFVGALSFGLWCPVLDLRDDFRIIVSEESFFGPLFFVYLVTIALSFVTGILLGGAILFSIFSTAYGEVTSPSSSQEDGTDYVGVLFFLGWILQFIESEKGTILAFVEMVLFRFWNALKIISYCFIVWPIWLVVAMFAMANTKTRMSALCAGLLSFAHLGVSHAWLGGIDYANINFWLSFVCALVAGYYFGGKIARMDFAKKKRSPSFPFPEMLVQE